MATTRQSIIRGPGTITYNSLKLFDKDGISAEIESSTESVNSSFGSLDTIKTDQIGRVTLTPIGNLSEDLIALFYPSCSFPPVSYGLPDVLLPLIRRSDVAFHLIVIRYDLPACLGQCQRFQMLDPALRERCDHSDTVLFHVISGILLREDRSDHLTYVGQRRKIDPVKR